jgi:hypothetical protein
VAKGKYEYWLTDEGLLLLAGWARDGLTDEQIAVKCGISTSTLYEWKNKYSEISESLKKGKDIADFEVENALHQKALSGDVAAMIFWLKNRRPKKWRDKPIGDDNNGMDAILALTKANLELAKNVQQETS